MHRSYGYLVQTYSPEVVEFIGSSFIQFITIWALGLFFILIDSFWFFTRHKIHPPSEQPTWNVLWRCFFGVLRNQLLMSSFHLAELFLLHPLVWHPWTFCFEPQFPPLTEILSDLLFCTLAREVLFYYGYCALHQPSLYCCFHKQHHEFTVLVALAS
jgi:sterol desaturase/sphingolipid hydroxylase (fatty acid hydroxylase superfamily)